MTDGNRPAPGELCAHLQCPTFTQGSAAVGAVRGSCCPGPAVMEQHKQLMSAAQSLTCSRADPELWLTPTFPWSFWSPSVVPDWNLEVL